MAEQREARAHVAAVMAVIERRTVAFAGEELCLPARRGGQRLHDLDQLHLRDLTALITIGPWVDLHIAYSFSAGLIAEIARRLTRELRPDEMDMSPYLAESACEMVNIVVGNSTAELAGKGEILRLSPPVVMAGAKIIHRRGQAMFALDKLEFQGGGLDIAFVGPRHLFDRTLDYRETPA